MYDLHRSDQILTHFELGKNWKIQKNATVRNQQPKQLRKSWEQRTKERERHASAKNLEKQLKADKQAEKDVRKGFIEIFS